MDSSRIDFLKAQIVGLSDHEKSLPVGSPARRKLSEVREEYTRELDGWLNLPPAPTLRAKHDEPSHLVAELLSQLDIVGLRPEAKEFRFHPDRKWRFDLAWPSLLIAVEVHGGTWANGRHTRGGGFEKDREKMNEAALLGWLVLEVTGDHIQTGQALSWVEKALDTRKTGGAS
jgi:hypothetical protein